MKSIYSAFINAQKAFGPALKTSTNPHFRSRYADLATCVEAVIDALNNNGLGLIQKTHECDTGVKVETILVHESGEQLSFGILHVPAQKQDAINYGSALTYARRYSLMAACAIAPEDDDGSAASKLKAPVTAPKAPSGAARVTHYDISSLDEVAKGKASKYLSDCLCQEIEPGRWKCPIRLEKLSQYVVEEHKHEKEK